MLLPSACSAPKPLILLLLLLLPILGGLTTSSALQLVKPSIEQEGSVNLGAILKHQEALEAECANYHERALKTFLESRTGGAQDTSNYAVNHGDILDKPVAVKVPAVCLFLFSRFRKTEPWKQLSHQGKLDFVNWIYNEEELMNLQQHEKQQQQQQQQSIGKSKAPDNYLPKELLVSKSFTQHDDTSPDTDNELDSGEDASNDELRLHHGELDTVMAMDQFHRVIEKSRAKLVTRLSPVVLVPGLLGSRLQGKYDKAHRVNILCSKQGDWKDLWLSLKNLLPILIDCWVDNVRLEYDPTTGYTSNPEGVLSRVPDFGSVESVRYLDTSHPKLTSYFAELIDAYQELGYTPDVNLLAAPYDFRLAPQQLTHYYASLKQLIEEAQSVAPTKKVTLVCHSLGCTHLLVFLRQQSSTWRQSHIRKLVAISSPWGGSAKALKALVVGDRLDLPAVSEAKMRQIALNYPSIAFLLPQPEVFSWSKNNNNKTTNKGGPTLVKTPERSYKAADIEDLLNDLGLQHQAKWYKDTSALIKPLQPLPDLHVDCIHSVNISTPETLLFAKQSDFPDKDYELLKGPGDGTVNLVSLMVCKTWAQMLPDKVIHRTFHNTNHVGLLKHKSLLTFLRDDVLASN